MLYLENARNSFSSASGLFGKGSEGKFYHNLSLMIPDKVDVDTLILAMKVALRDEDKSYDNSFGYISLIPRYVDQIASLEFATEFRNKFIEEILGLDVNELNTEVDYGCTEVEPNLVDISNKDFCEVFAALYNASYPIGAGFFQYDSEPWNAKIADMFFKYKYGENYRDESMYLDYVKGRNMDLKINGNLLYVRNYNIANGIGLAQQVIRTIPNKDLDVQKLKK